MNSSNLAIKRKRKANHHQTLPLTGEGKISHIVKVETQIRDVNALRQACNFLQLEPPVHSTYELYNSTETGWGVHLRDWRYPVVFKVETAEAAFDNYQGRWGDPQRLDELIQRYAAEKTKIEARRQGYSVTEQRLDDGSVKLSISVGGEN